MTSRDSASSRNGTTVRSGDVLDVVVIGAGPGGYAAAIRTAQLGLQVALVERDNRLGGVCTLRGCIPTKALLHTADVLEDARHGGELGVVASEVRLDLAAAHAFKNRVVEKNSAGVGFLMKKNGVRVVQGFGTLAGPGRVRVTDSRGEVQELQTRHVLLATGSAPKPLPGLPFDGERVLSSDHALELSRVPGSLAIIGGGAVGVEFASLYSRFGSRVSLIEMMPHLLPLEDVDVSTELERSLRRRGLEVHTGAKLEDSRVTPNGVTLTLRTADGGTRTVEAEKLLVAAGRRPLTEGLGLEALGVKLERGFVPVDGRMRTSVPGLYAIGDIVPTPALAHVATMEAIVAAEAIAGLEPQPIDYAQVPSCTYSAPEVASIGLTEARARERGFDVRVGRFPFSALGKARVLDHTEGFVKLVSDARYGELLGVHLIGPHVTELLAEAGVALRLEATVEELARTMHAHPTLSEVIHEAAEVALGHPLHL
ncbi:dihydrolipoyl dehydrogenase [Archangium lansingense]|uniref:Dihydrolipoyl dehydrogenase n=1 Tax=Archangium lansingense TaxID=2995310 RepID=A0ABT4ALQ5_9BACT|nr:dihydrolipoyl dehydrogenase [Archangium lansinium]MCY1082617.1 dihydrolipoyl dehydrogenase [Archangium lansinium]